MSNELVFTVLNGICYCGTNDLSSLGNAAKYPSQISGKIIIPLKFGDNYVNEVGKSAFFQCSKITEVCIEARITKINERAFSDCSGLLKINIPSSVTYIGNRAIHFYIANTAISKGVSTVIFEKRRKSLTIEENGIAARESINIFIPNKIDTSCPTNAINLYTMLIVYSKNSFTICGVETSVEPKFFQEKRTSCQERTHSRCLLTIINAL